MSSSASASSSSASSSGTAVGRPPGYRALLRVPGASAFFFAAAVGRVGLAMTGIGLLWLVHARFGSYGVAGAATAAFALSEALIGPQTARLVDRFGQRRILPFCLVEHVCAIAGVLASTGPATLAAAAAFAGAAVPQLGAYSAARWARLLRGAGHADELRVAFSLESLANATAFLLGPVLVTALGAAGRERTACALAASLILLGGGALAVQSRTAPPPQPRAVPGGGHRSILLRADFLRLAALNLAIGVYFGTMSVSISAFAVGHGVPGAAAPITAAASLSGLLAGWLFGLRRTRRPASVQLIVATAYLAGTGLLLPLATSPLWLGAAVVLTEAAVPPTLVLLNVLTERSVEPAVLTQALTWNNSASAAGSALASSAAGRLADHWGTSASFMLAPFAGLALLLLAFASLSAERPASSGS